jgi:Zn-dependent M28 family amino/carboxypeptidase
MMSRARSSGVVGLAVLLLGCQPQWSGFSEPQIDAALAAAENVRPETIAGQVREIYQARDGVRLLLTDGEELGMVGAERYLEEFGSSELAMVLNADMIAHLGSAGGLLTREPAGVEYILQANERSAEAAFQLADLARRLPEAVALRPVVFPDDGVSVIGFAVGSVLSDHGPFWLRGAKALFPFPAGDKPDWYHTPEDTPERVDADRLRRMGRLWSAAIAAFATRAP